MTLVMPLVRGITESGCGTAAFTALNARLIPERMDLCMMMYNFNFCLRD
jgi:hypothetical protein